MNWLEKVNYLIECDKNEKPDDPFLYDVCFTGNYWTPEEIQSLIHNYPWLPQTYLNFIQAFDGISIAFCRFYGSKDGDAIPLHEAFDESESCLKAGYFPFGRYADGSMFIFNHEGHVFWWDKYDYDFEEEPKWLANSLEEFISDCLMGRRYQEFAFIEDNNYYTFLKSMNWV